MDVYELLDTINRRPTFYLHEKSLKALRAFLAGYEAGLSQHGRSDVTLSHLRPFNEWVAKHYGYAKAGPRSWFTMILSKTESDEKAYDVFFELLDKFKQKPGTGN
jgi:hypothetical protein